MTSGAIQNGVPTNVSRLLVVFVSWPATPKSANFTSPDSDSRTFAAETTSNTPYQHHTTLNTYHFWDWLDDQQASSCCFCHLSIPKMTYNVSSGTLTTTHSLALTTAVGIHWLGSSHYLWDPTITTAIFLWHFDVCKTTIRRGHKKRRYGSYWI